MEAKELDELLDKVFLNVNSWLNFAEAKNAANLALVVACIVAFLSFNSTNLLLYVICILFLFSGICSMISFIPMLGNKIFKNKIFKNNIKKDESDNLLFFKDIKNYSGVEYVEQVSKLYLKNNKKEFSRYQLDLANEITYNSNIASYKYKLFTVAAYLDVVAFMLLVIFIGVFQNELTNIISVIS